MCRLQGFNPRPSRKRGATAESMMRLTVLPVFQSSPLSQEGRYGPRPPRARGSRAVSILAPLARGALPLTSSVWNMYTPFQSSPLSQEGRYEASKPVFTAYSCFNPRPSRKRGATDYQKQLHQSIGVSILAPLARGALRSRRPRPSTSGSVSILAPLARGALHALDSTTLGNDEFQSSPLSQEGRYLRAAIQDDAGEVFQSSPLSQEGRYVQNSRDCHDAVRFNPRPSRKRGATTWTPDREPWSSVSILAPLARGALPSNRLNNSSRF